MEPPKELIPVLGYLQLGMCVEANDEIEAMPPALKTDPVVLKLRVMIYRELEAWQLMREVSGFLARHQPEDSSHVLDLAFSTRRCRSIEEAEEILAEALKPHPREAIIHYNLACYNAQMGHLPLARHCLAKAIELDASYRQLALDDPDLEPMWEEMRATD